MMHLRSLTLAALALLGSVVGSSFSRGDDWPQFRGPNASGVSAETKPLPVEFSLEKNVRWSAELGEGIASPIVASGRLFATAMTGPEQFSVFAFDAASGKRLWRRDLATGALPAITQPNSQASSTPTADAERVYVYFSTLGLLTFDAASGEDAWRKELPKPHYLMDWGAASSPIVYEDLLIFSSDDDLAPFLIAVDKKTGDTRWRIERTEMLAGYSTPVIATSGERRDLVVAGTGKMIGYDPLTGDERWTCNSLVRTIMTSPVVRGDVVYLSVQSYGDTERVLKYALLEWKDTDQNGKLTKAEVPPEFAARFDAGDADGDGFLVEAEIDAAFQSPSNMAGGGSIVQAIRAGGAGDVTKTHMVWSLTNKSPSNLSSPLAIGEQLFMVKRGGLCSSFSLGNGEAQWEIQRLKNLGEYYASPVAGDGKIYAAGENGFVVVLAAGPKLQVLAKNDLGGSIVATPAISDGRIYFRTREKLICVGEEGAVK